MSQNKTTEEQSAPIFEDLAIQDMKAKREMAKRLMEGDGVDKDEAKAVSLLEDCVARGDADAMVMLAKCCALGRGIEHDAKRAEALVSEAAKKGNHEACILLQLINDWKGKESIDLKSLWMCFNQIFEWKNYFCVVYAGRVKGECTIERVALVMNIVPCRVLNLECKAKKKQSHAHFFSLECLQHVFKYITTGNKIGDTGATSLSEALKSNTTLTKLNLGGEDKRKKTHKRDLSTIHSVLFLVREPTWIIW